MGGFTGSQVHILNKGGVQVEADTYINSFIPAHRKHFFQRNTRSLMIWSLTHIIAAHLR